MFIGASAENYRNGEFLIRELPGDLSRDQVTLKVLNDAATTWLTGTILGQILIGALVGAMAGGNTGGATITAAPTAGAKTKVGVYSLYCYSVTGGYWFLVTDPNGKVIGIAKEGTAFVSQDVNFTITANGANTIIGDTGTVTVAAGSGLYTILAPAAVDGSQNAVAVLYLTTYVGGAVNLKAAVIDAWASVAIGLINWPAGITDNQKAIATAQLFALGIKMRANV